MMPLSKVTDLTFQRTFGGRLLGYGTLIVESAGQIQALNKIRYMPRPEEIYEALSELIFGRRARPGPTGCCAGHRAGRKWSVRDRRWGQTAVPPGSLGEMGRRASTCTPIRPRRMAPTPRPVVAAAAAAPASTCSR